MPELLRGYAMISAFLAIAAPIVYAYASKSLLSDIMLNSFYYVNIVLSVLFFYELIRPYVQRRHLQMNALGLIVCVLLRHWIKDEELSVNLLCLSFNLCAYFNEILGCLSIEEEKY